MIINWTPNMLSYHLKEMEIDERKVIDVIDECSNKKREIKK